MLRAGLIALAALFCFPGAADAVLVYQRPATREIVVARNDGSQPRAVAHGYYALVSPDGRRLVFARNTKRGSDLRVISTKGGRSRLLLHDADAAPSFPDLSPHWSPNGRYVLVGSASDGEAYIFDVIRRTRRRVGLLLYAGASFDPPSKRVAFAAGDLRSSTLFVYRLNPRHSRSIGDGGSPAWGRGGLAFTREQKGLLLVKHPGGQRRLLVPASTRVLYPVGWSAHGGRLLAAQGDTEFTLKALLITPSSGQVVTFAPTFSEIDGLSKNGRHVLGVVDGNVVTAAADGSSRVLASSASSASWTR